METAQKMKYMGSSIISKKANPKVLREHVSRSMRANQRTLSVDMERMLDRSEPFFPQHGSPQKNQSRQVRNFQTVDKKQRYQKQDSFQGDTAMDKDRPIDYEFRDADLNQEFRNASNIFNKMSYRLKNDPSFLTRIKGSVKLAENPALLIGTQAVKKK